MYCRDAHTYIELLDPESDGDTLSFDITPELVGSYLAWLRTKPKPLQEGTVGRRMVGLIRFWKFCYKIHFVLSSPMTLDDMI